jgi:GntP family gluconate:H+ symporter
MNPLLILLIGMALVVGGILVLRLHAFLALIGAALLVALLTPALYNYRFALRGAAIPVERADAAAGTVVLKADAGRLVVGSPLRLARAEGAAWREAASLRVTEVKPKSVVATFETPGATIAPGDLVVEPAAFAAAAKAADRTIGDRVAAGFGETVLSIGILIAMAAIVGETLLQSGAAERIVSSSRRMLGDNRASLAFLIAGFILGIPVFFDTVFYLLIPLGKVMRVRSGRDYTLYVLSIVAGATMTHSLVPPTPGPLAVAAMLNVNLATMILGGLAVGAFASASGYLYALYANRRWDIPLRATAGLSDAELADLAKRDDVGLPPLWLSLLPILLPVLLISADAFAGSLKVPEGAPRSVLRTLGEKNVSLTVSAVIGLLMAARWRPSKDKSTGAAVAEGLASAGVIILVTSAGGAFGYVLRQTDIAATLKDLLPNSQHALLPLAFVAAAVIRTAQGSATVAMITAAGIVSPFALAGGLPFHPVYLALAIGCGSKPVMWMNDSGFWIIGKMSGFTEAETLKTATVMMTIMGVVGLLATMAGAWLFPMVP